MQLFIDTNIFLTFYALNHEDLQELSKLVDSVAAGEVTLWITDQIVDEFYRNREQRIEGTLKSFYSQAFNPQLPQICEKYPEVVPLRTALKEYEKAHSAIIEKISVDIKTKNLQADHLVHQLFDRGTRVVMDAAVVERAKLRMSLGNPPGKNNSLGDALNWECLLMVVPDGTDLYLISGDKDYSSPFGEDELSGFMRDEWERRKQSTIYFYRRLSSFLKAQLPEVAMASQRDRDFLVRELAGSQSLPDVHKYVARLRTYTEFTSTQVNGMVMAALNNQRVTWAIEEETICTFFQDIMVRYACYLDADVLEHLGFLVASAAKADGTTAPTVVEVPPTDKPQQSIDSIS